ncbi:zinc finger MYND domain-containing protein [Phanerochaete sordida]|uniref:Zinc finger MYND domain-containing protein n=1 Tax=Phanerochaete sordida TaxID=48140 RepID=A0A9P3G6Y9_9APHY|nr:zinc finger MYND domain-containing protein [Phanerochaete sordida]
MSQPTSWRKELTQCQYCWKRKAPGVTFHRCSGCKVDIYCGTECQRAAWPSHKAKCKLNSRPSAMLPHDVAQLVEYKQKTLRAFTSKHRPALCEAGTRALDLGRSPRNAEHHFLRIRVRQRPGAQLAHLLYTVEDAEVVAYADLPAAQATEMQGVLREANRTRGEGMDGTFFVMLLDVVTNVCNIAPVSFGKSATYSVPMPYKEFLVEHLDGGIVL